MALNDVLGAGYEPRTNPAHLSLNQSQSINGAGTLNFTITMPDPILVKFLQVNVNCTQDDSDSQNNVLTVSLIIDGKIVETIEFLQSLGTLQTAVGDKTIYNYQTQREDIFERDSQVIFRVTTTAPFGSPDITVTANINIWGNFI